VPDINRTIDVYPTIIGQADPNTLVIIKGISGGVFTEVARVTSDANGNFRVEPTTPLDKIANNRLVPFVGILEGLSVFNLNVVDPTTTDQVPTITSPTFNQRISGAKPTIKARGSRGRMFLF